MFVGKVIGTVWSTVKWPELGGHKLLVVRPYHLDTLRARARSGQAPGAAEPGQSAAAEGSEMETVICVDLLDAGVGDDVVVAFGHAARVAAESENSGSAHAPSQGSSQSSPKTPPQGSPRTPIDAAVVAVVDGYSLPDLVDPVALDGSTR